METVTIPKYINKKEFCKELNISPNTTLKELKQAVKDGCGAVIRIGKCYRINLKEFFQWKSKNDKIKEATCQKEMERIQTKKDCIQEEGYGGLRIPEQESNSAYQLVKRLCKMQQDIKKDF